MDQAEHADVPDVQTERRDVPLDVSPASAGEAARGLRAILAAYPPANNRERALARRIEGAAVTLDALAGSRTETDR